MSIPEQEERSLLLVYATETGNAQDAADYVARQCRRIALRCRVVGIDNFSLPDLLNENIVIFIVSTTGSGVEPRSMTPLWTNLLRSDLPTDTFEGLYFAVFGLGDTAYEKFCWAAKKLSRRMESLGACEFHARGEGDGQHPFGIDGALRPWTDELINILQEMIPFPPGVEVLPAGDVPLPRVSLTPTSQATLEGVQDPLKSDLQYHRGVLKANKRITDHNWYQDVRHLELQFQDNVQYEPGDVAVIHPSASASDVNKFLSTMGWEDQAEQPFQIKQMAQDQSLPDHLPEVTTLRRLFTRFLDFNAVPRRSFFQYIAHFTSNELEKEKLEEFLSPAGADELYEYCYRVRRTIHEVLSEFRYVKVPIDYIFDAFPPLRPREFSIASSVKKYPHQIHLCIAMVKYRTKLKVPRKGVCTSYLSELTPGDSLLVGIKKGTIRLPLKLDTPIICVGPGTGIAPMRAVIEERIHYGARSNTLYFGCRSASKDQHYSTEWREYADTASLRYRTAFSRDGPEGEKRTYVQDVIRADAEHIWKVVDEHKGWVFISGSSNKMPLAVKEAIAFAAETQGGYSAEQAKQYVHTMVQEGRLIEECWS